jgi:ferredoxin
VRVDRAKCVGHGRCYVLAPDVYSEDERGYCVIPRAEVPPALRDAARLGAENCPETAILLEDG